MSSRGMSNSRAGPSIGVVRVHVLEAKKLRKPFGPTRFAPYAAVCFEKETFVTDAVKDENAPTWNETVDFNVQSRRSEVHVSVRNKSKLNDSLIGSVRISLPDVAASSESTSLSTAPLNTPSQFLSSVLAFSSPPALGGATEQRGSFSQVHDDIPEVHAELRKLGYATATVRRWYPLVGRDRDSVTGLVHLRIVYTYSPVVDFIACFSDDEQDFLNELDSSKRSSKSKEKEMEKEKEVDENASELNPEGYIAALRMIRLSGLRFIFSILPVLQTVLFLQDVFAWRNKFKSLLFLLCFLWVVYHQMIIFALSTALFVVLVRNYICNIQLMLNGEDTGFALFKAALDNKGLDDAQLKQIGTEVEDVLYVLRGNRPAGPIWELMQKIAMGFSKLATAFLSVRRYTRRPDSQTGKILCQAALVMMCISFYVPLFGALLLILRWSLLLGVVYLMTIHSLFTLYPETKKQIPVFLRFVALRAKEDILLYFEFVRHAVTGAPLRVHPATATVIRPDRTHNESLEPPTGEVSLPEQDDTQTLHTVISPVPSRRSIGGEQPSFAHVNEGSEPKLVSRRSLSSLSGLASSGSVDPTSASGSSGVSSSSSSSSSENTTTFDRLRTRLEKIRMVREEDKKLRDRLRVSAVDAMAESLMYGTLWKQPFKARKLRAWQKKLWVLTPTALYYFLSANDMHAAGMIATSDITVARITELSTNARPFTFAVHSASSNRNYVLATETEEELEHWLSALEEAHQKAVASDDALLAD